MVMRGFMVDKLETTHDNEVIKLKTNERFITSNKFLTVISLQ